MIRFLDSCASTSSELALCDDAPHGFVVAARSQTAGRGQRGNSWEAEPGKNLTFSILLRPCNLHPARQFELSMVVSLAIADAIDKLLPAGLRTIVKWPNDIYVGLEKICGILIENKLSPTPGGTGGMVIERSIAGIGINVNQKVFLSDAPNPTSVILHNGGAETSLEPFLADVCRNILEYWSAYEAAPDAEVLRQHYFSRLLWTSGEHRFADKDGRFTAHIVSVASDGMLTLSNGRTYAFKEVSFLVSD
ncbi:MAG: biotin--[acetyl-CoA-carboxylase] ligase [Muribaculaceae bacterium]|nr:biotin--[acetyl-CoA-carboxylase] ligase [Muribaculaceae bacterium]